QGLPEDVENIIDDVVPVETMQAERPTKTMGQDVVVELRAIASDLRMRLATS
ncbi:MAG: hypothetical protein FD121_1695, partial [Gallionellaceae bacterium]